MHQKIIWMAYRFLTSSFRISCHQENDLRFYLQFHGLQVQQLDINTERHNLYKWRVTAKAAKRPYLLRQLKLARVSSEGLVSFYCSAIRSSLVAYACALWRRG